MNRQSRFAALGSGAALVCMSLFATSAVGDDWPQWRGVDRDGTWRETGVVATFDTDQIPIRWRQPIGAGYSGPTVAMGRVYVTDRIMEPASVERIHCFDEHTGEPRWTHSYPCEYTISYAAGPRASVTIEGGQAFALGAMGHLHCMATDSGTVLWKRDLNTDYRITEDGRMPMWGIAAAPLVYQDLVIIVIGGKRNNSLIALDRKSGEQRWQSLSDRAQYSAPIIVRQMGKDILVCWTGDAVVGLAPATGTLFWRFPFTPSRMPIGVPTPVVCENRLFVTSFYDGSLMLRLREDKLDVEQVWRASGPSEKQTEALHSMISTPVFDGQYVYGVDSYGQLRCLDANTGERIWEDLTATPKARWSNIHTVVNRDRVWMFNERGELIIAQLSRQGFHEISRTKLLQPTTEQLRQRGGVCWSHPAFANRHVFARNDQELVCASLATASR